VKSFRFRLQRVLQLRTTAEQEAARRLAAARSEEIERRQILDLMVLRLAEATGQVIDPPEDLRTAGTIGNLKLAVEGARLRHASAEEDYRRAAARLEAAVAAFGEARQARRALEKLKEQRHETWEREVERAEQQTIDEVALRVPRGGQAAG